MPDLIASPSLRDIQQYIHVAELERGFEKETLIERCLLLGEEVGELFKDVRKLQGMKTAAEHEVALAHELADVIFIAFGIANVAGIDLEEAFRAKEEINKKRTWK